MDINKSSWHARLYLDNYKTVDNPNPTLPASICPYFWSLVGILLGRLYILIIIIMIVVVLGYLVYSMIHIHNIPVPKVKDNYYKNLQISAGTGYFVFGSFFTMFLGYLIYNTFFTKGKKYILIEMFKALFNKLCPKINWID